MKDPKGHGSNPRNHLSGSRALSQSHAFGGSLKPTETFKLNQVGQFLTSTSNALKVRRPRGR